MSTFSARRGVVHWRSGPKPSFWSAPLAPLLAMRRVRADRGLVCKYAQENPDRLVRHLQGLRSKSPAVAWHVANILARYGVLQKGGA